MKAVQTEVPLVVTRLMTRAARLVLIRRRTVSLPVAARLVASARLMPRVARAVRRRRRAASLRVVACTFARLMPRVARAVRRRRRAASLRVVACTFAAASATRGAAGY